MRNGMQKGSKAMGKTSSWKTPLGGKSMMRNPNCSLVLGVYCFSAPHHHSHQRMVSLKSVGFGERAFHSLVGWQSVFKGDGNEQSKDKCHQD